MTRADFYVYVLFRHDTGQPFYVGKGCGSRWLRSEHDKGNPHKSRIVAAAHRAGCEIPKVIVQQELSEQEALFAEIAVIAAIGRCGLGGILANNTDGGDSPPVRTTPHKLETIAKMKVSAAGRKPSKNTIAAMILGMMQSAETVRKRTGRRKGDIGIA